MVCSISGSFIKALYLKVHEIFKKTGSRQQVHQKNVCFVIIHMFVMVAMLYQRWLMN